MTTKGIIYNDKLHGTDLNRRVQYAFLSLDPQLNDVSMKSSSSLALSAMGQLSSQSFI